VTTTVETDVRTMPLTDDEVRSFIRRGFLFPGRLFTITEVDRLRARLDELLAVAEVPETIDRFSLAPRVPFLTGLWKTDELFRSVTFDPRLRKWAGQLMGTKTLAFLLDNAIIKPPKVGGELHWHQDWQAWPVAPCEVVTAWIALEDVTTDNGAMEMAVGSHALGRFLPQDAVTGHPKNHPGMAELIGSGMRPMPDPVELGVEIVPIELKAGEISLHHGLMWHRSGINTTPSTRHSLIQRYADGASRYSGKNYSAVDFAPNPHNVDRRLDELDLFTVMEVPPDQDIA